MTLNVLENDFDPEGRAISVQWISNIDGSSYGFGSYDADFESGIVTFTPPTPLPTDTIKRRTIVHFYRNRAAAGPYSDFSMLTVIWKRDNNPPVAVPDAVTTTQGTAVTFNIFTNDSDPDNGDELLLLGFTQDPSNGSITQIDGGDNPGLVMYTPNPNFVGFDTITYQVADGFGGVDTASIEVTVEPFTAALPPPHFRFFLINADTNQVEEEPFDNGATLDILSSSAGAAPQSSFVAVWDVYRRPLVQSLVFNLDGPVTRRNHTESYALFTVFGEDSTGAFRGRVLLNGNYTLSV